MTKLRSYRYRVAICVLSTIASIRLSLNYRYHIDETSNDAETMTRRVSNSTVLILDVVKDCGADGTGKKLANGAFLAAMALAELKHAALELVVPEGIYRLRPMALISDMTLVLHNATLQAVTPREGDDGTIDAWPTTPAMASFGIDTEYLGSSSRYDAFLHADHVKNLKIMGSGTVDASGAYWWSRHHSRKKLPLRFARPHALEIRHSIDVTISGVQIINSAFWTVNIYNSQNVKMHNIAIHNPESGRYQDRSYPAVNTVGVALNSCLRCELTDSVIDTGDDAVAIKSGLNQAGIRYNAPSRDIVIRNITARSIRGAGIAVGSEMSGGVGNVSVTDCLLHDSKYGVRIKSLRGRGGVVEHLDFSNLRFVNIRPTMPAISLSMVGSRHPGWVPHWNGWRLMDIPIFRHISFRALEFDEPSSVTGINVEGVYKMAALTAAGRPIQDVHFEGDTLGDSVHLNCANANRVQVNGKAVPCKAELLYLNHAFEAITGWFHRSDGASPTIGRSLTITA